jgi:pSer/pThr/pTyr-binding forkhead associated (FHA) protein
MMDNDLVVDDTSVSRHHAEIRRRRDGSFEVLDLNSMNGVFVNGKKIRES